MNIYDSAFEENKMVSWTMSCDIPPPGGILSWAPEIYNITNNNNTKAVIGEVASDDLCQNSKKNVLEIFDDGTGKSPAMSEDTCARLNGRLDLVPTTENEAYETLEEYKEYTMKRNITTWFPTWLSGRADMNRTELIGTKAGYQVYPKDGKWLVKDSHSGEVLGLPFAADSAGHTYARPTQECFVCGFNPALNNTSSFNGKFCRAEADCIYSFSCSSQKCDRSDMPVALMCKFKQKLRLRLKGICKYSKVDTDYLLLGYEVLDEGRYQMRKYGGSTGWLLAHDKEQDMWQLKHEHYPDLTLSMEDKDTLPVGVHSWVAANDTCSLGNTVRLVLCMKTI